MSDINDIEGIIQRDKDRISQLEKTYKERSEEALTKIKNFVESSDVVKRLDEITDYINSKQDANWNKPFIKRHSFEITPDIDTYIRHEESNRKKPKYGLSAETIYPTKVAATFQYVAETEKTFWKRSKWIFVVDIYFYEDDDRPHWSYDIHDNRGRNLNEIQFWKDFKNEIAERYS